MIRRLSRLRRFRLTPAVAGLLFAIMLGGAMVHSNATAFAAGAETYRQLDIFGDIFERVRSQYVTEPEEEDLIRDAINGMLQSLDPHSSYLDPKESDAMRVQTKGEFGGLGIQVTMENKLIKVISPIEGTPADKAGILSGDLVSEIDGEQVFGMTLQEAVDKMRGPVNTPIELTVLRKGAERPLNITIIRDVIVIKSVKYRVEGEDVGYIDINEFTEKTYPGIEEAVKKIGEEVDADKLKGYIIDLRRNPGGLLTQAVLASDAFLDRGEIVSTRGREKGNIQRETAKPGDLTKGKPIIVLINGGSASASEIVAGALQDHRRGTIVGTRSFGKGSVQTIIPLGPNGALRLTTALYYTPSGCSIQGKGIDPDIVVEQPLPEEYRGLAQARGESKLRNSIENQNQNQNEGEGEGEGEDQTEQKTESGSYAYVPPDPKDDIQLNYAIDLMRGNKQDDAFPPDVNNLEVQADCKPA